MSDAPDPDFDRSLFVRVRREGPSEALRQRILVQGRAELSRAQSERAEFESGRRAPARSGRVRLRRAPFAGLLACAAVLAGLLWLRGKAEERIGITAENTAPRSAEPKAPAPEPARASEVVAPAPEPPPAPRQSAAARATTPVRVAARGVSVGRKSGDAGAALAAPALEAPPAVPPAPSLAEQVDQIKRARAALRAGQSDQALLLLDEYQSGRGGTELAAEARLLRIEALAAAGRKSEAASEARRFATDFPTSPLIDRAQSFVRP